MTVTPIDTATRLLAQSSSDALLDVVVQLTHQIHTIKSTVPVDTEKLAERRAMRALVRAEVLRRIGGNR